jgi:hypothetical protein
MRLLCELRFGGASQASGPTFWCLAVGIVGRGLVRLPRLSRLRWDVS